MKSVISLVLCLCLCLCACTPNTKPQQTQPTTTASSSIPETTTDDTHQDAYTEQLIAVSIPTIKVDTLAEDGTCIFTYSCQDFSLTMDDPLVAEEITHDFFQKTDFSNSAQQVLNAANAAYSGQQDWSPYSCSILYNPIRLDQSILSFYGTEIVENGGPRPTSNNISVTYDMNSGIALTLKDILVAGYSSDELTNRIIGSLEELSKKGVLFADYEYIIYDLFSTNTPMERWFFSDVGLCFYFTPYEIAPYNAGTVVAEVPYSQLVGILKDIYFPTEQVNYDGSMNTSSAKDTDLNNYNRFAEVILDEEGAEYVLAPKGTTLNVRIQIGTWSDSFASDYTVFAATGLTDGDAILLQVSSNQLQNLAISYNNIIFDKIQH